MKTEDEGGFYDVQDFDGVVHSITMIPSIARVMYAESQSHVITIDGAHTCYSHMKIILAVMKDGNGKLQIVAARLCPSESEKDFTEFLYSIKDYIVKNDKECPIIMSDRAPGLIAAAKTVFGGNFKIHSCLVHLLRNVETWCYSYGVKVAERRRVKSIVSRLARTESEEREKQLYEELSSISPQITNRLLGLDSLWSRLMTTEKTFGVITNNAAECSNSLLKRPLNYETSVRDAYVFDMIVSLYSVIQTQQEVRCDSIKKCLEKTSDGKGIYNAITPYVMKTLNRHVQSIRPAGDSPARIYNWSIINNKVCIHTRNKNNFYVVDLENHSCTCGMYQVMGYPCIHAVIYMYYYNITIDRFMVNLVDPYYHVFTVLRTCSKSLPNIPDFTLDDVTTEDTIPEDEERRRSVHQLSQHMTSSILNGIYSLPVKSRTESSMSRIAQVVSLYPQLTKEVGHQTTNEKTSTASRESEKRSAESPSSNVSGVMLENKRRRVETRHPSKQERRQTIATSTIKKRTGRAGSSQGVTARRNGVFGSEQHRVYSLRGGKKKIYKNVDPDYLPSD